MGKITSNVERITPEKAARMLEANNLNRPIKRMHVKQLAAEMRGGKWRIAQPISFNGDGTLIDGQHRLSAIIEAGVPVDVLVVRGIESDTFGVFDQGKNRSAADLFSLMGGSNASVVTSVASSMISRGERPKFGGDRPTRQDIAEYAVDHSAVIELVVSSLRPVKYMSTAMKAAFAVAVERYGEDAISPMMERLANGVYTGRYDPMNTLSRWIVDKLARGKGRKVHTPRWVAYSAAVLAIRADLEGRDLQVLKPNGQDFTD